MVADPKIRVSAPAAIYSINLFTQRMGSPATALRFGRKGVKKIFAVWRSARQKKFYAIIFQNISTPWLMLRLGLSSIYVYREATCNLESELDVNRIGKAIIFWLPVD